jgi:OOP family OmpA-OmpF porin
MKFLIILSVFIVYLNAVEINDKEFPLVLPVSVEEFHKVVNNDFDDDGVVNEKDKCPDTKKVFKVDEFGCRLLKDKDNDGVVDKDDKCPNTKKDVHVDSTGCAPDEDNDGVADSIDKCPQTSKEFLVDNVGCPQTTVLNINFEESKYRILKDSYVKIKKFAEFLKQNSSYQAIIYGYTDSSTNKTISNRELSQKRANVVMDALIDYGIKITRLTAIGMGAKNPIADNDTPQGRAKNRRIEVELLQ